MEGLTVAGVIGLVGLVATLCSLASFYLGRKKAASDEGAKDGELHADIKYIKKQLQDNTEAMEKMTARLEAVDNKREEDFRSLLIKCTELETNQKSLKEAIRRLESK